MSNNPPLIGKHVALRWSEDIIGAKGGPLPPLPKIRLEDLPEDVQQTIRQLEGTKRWHLCHYCTKLLPLAQLKACAGCNVRTGYQVLYCSRECQRNAWPSHKIDCKLQVIDDSAISLSSSKWYSATWSRRREGIMIASAWAWRQLLLMDPSINLQATMLIVWVDSIKKGLDHFLPRKLMLHPTSKPFPGCNPPTILTVPVRKVGLVQFIFDGRWQQQMYVDLGITKNRENRIMEQYHPSWPWIFASIASMGNTSALIASYKVHALMSVLLFLKIPDIPDNPLTDFAMPMKLAIRVPWKIAALDRWQDIVGTVVSF